MKTTYRIKGYIAHSEIDNWDQGCIGTTKTEWGDWYSIEADSIAGLLEKLSQDFCAASNADVLLDSCDEDGRIDLQVWQAGAFEVGNVDEDLIANWKAGKIDLWLTCYSFQVEKVVTGFSLVDEVQA